MKLKLALFCGLALAGANAMACYTVYDGHARVLWQGTNPPVDMSLPLHEAVQRRFGQGATMVFNESASCKPLGVAEVARPSVGDVPPNTMRLERTGRQIKPTSSAPLFTDRQTAEQSNVPYTTVAGDIVRVPPAAADRAITATVTVLPTDTAVAAAGPDTTALGAGPDTRAMGAGPAPAPHREVVITELRDPPVTIVQQGGNVTVTPRR